MLHPKVANLVEWIENPYYGRICGFGADKVVFDCARQGRVWEPHLVEEFGKHIRPGSIAIDCGANIGLHTLAMLKAQPAAREIQAFEPNPEIHSVLCQNTQGKPQIKAINKGVGDRRSVMAAMPIGVSDNPAGATLHSARPRTWRQLFQKRAASDSYKVDVIPLDSLNLRDVSFVKIDVEGHEMQVIDGARLLLAEQRPSLVVEIWDLEDIPMRDSKIKTICDFGYEPVPLSKIDTLFLPTE